MYSHQGCTRKKNLSIMAVASQQYWTETVEAQSKRFPAAIAEAAGSVPVKKGATAQAKACQLPDMEGAAPTSPQTCAVKDVVVVAPENATEKEYLTVIVKAATLKEMTSTRPVAAMFAALAKSSKSVAAAESAPSSDVAAVEVEGPIGTPVPAPAVDVVPAPVDVPTVAVAEAPAATGVPTAAVPGVSAAVVRVPVIFSVPAVIVPEVVARASVPVDAVVVISIGAPVETRWRRQRKQNPLGLLVWMSLRLQVLTTTAEDPNKPEFVYLAALLEMPVARLGTTSSESNTLQPKDSIGAVRSAPDKVLSRSHPPKQSELRPRGNSPRCSRSINISWN